MSYADYREHLPSRTFINNGKKKGRGQSWPQPSPSESSSYELLAQSGSTFEKARRARCDSSTGSLKVLSQGVRSRTARPCSRSAGTETWSCTTTQTPSIRRKHAVQRNHRSVI